MIDKLLGRAELKARIDELEDENERLRRRYEAESDRRSEAATARQRAEREQNQLQDRIAQLEGELERLEAEHEHARDDGHAVEPRRRDRLRGAELTAVLDRLESVRTKPEGALTATLPANWELSDGVPDPLTDIFGDRTVLLEDVAPAVVYADDAQLISVELSPPIDPSVAESGSGQSGKPATANRRSANAETVTLEWGDRFRVDRSWFCPQGEFTLALVRADLFALGVYDGDERIDYHGFESDVKGSHSKGGFSQGRFERIREGQIADHLERCRDALSSHRTGPLYLVGQREAISRLVENWGVDPEATAAVDATGKPKPALEDAFRSFFTTELLVV
ncbi:Vms1/Ankzf1 family peptidyl-tRNA hydrolase [Natrialbaceae archaeon A-CW1-1]